MNLLLLLALAVGSLAGAQDPPTSTWAISKPFVDRWMSEYKEAGRTIAARDKMVGDIRQLLGEHPADIWAYEAAALGFNNLNMNNDALGVIREYVRRFPGDSTLDERLLFFFGNWGIPADLEVLPERWRDKLEYWKRLLQARQRVRTSPDLIEQAGKEVLKRIAPESDRHGNERFRIAETWLASGVEPRAAERLAREAVALSEIGERPAISGESAERRSILNRLLIVNVNRSVLGWALHHQGRFAEALAELKRAAAIGEKDTLSTREIYYRIGQTLEKLDRPAEAMESYFKELAWGDLAASTRAALGELYRRQHGSLEGLEVVQRTRVNELVAKRAETALDLVHETDEDLGRFDPLDEHGRPLDLTQYRGKLVIIEFWATWCGICRASMQHTDELKKKFPNDLVVVAPSWDPEESRGLAAKMLRDKNYQFVLVFDDERRRAVRLPYIPARLLLDRTGRLRFTEFGYTPAASALFERKVNALVR